MARLSRRTRFGRVAVALALIPCLLLAISSVCFAEERADREAAGYRGPVDTAHAYEIVNGIESSLWFVAFDPSGNLVERISYHRGNTISHEVYEYDDTGRAIMLRIDHNDWYEVVQFDEEGVPVESRAFTSEGELLGGAIADRQYTEDFRGYTLFDAEWTPYYQVKGVFDDQGVLQEILEYGPFETLIARVEHTYDSMGRLIEARFFNGDDVLTATIPYEYNEHGNLTRGVSMEYALLVMDAGWSPYEHPTAATYRYDDKGNLLVSTNIDPPTGETLSSTAFIYDEHGNILRQTNILTAFDYDDDGNILGPTPESGDDSVSETTYEYDAATNLLAETEINSPGRVSVTRYDEYGNRLEHLEYDPSRGHFIRVVIEYKYDEFGNWVEQSTRRVQVEAEFGDDESPESIITKVEQQSAELLANLESPEVQYQEISYYLQ